MGKPKSGKLSCMLVCNGIFFHFRATIELFLKEDVKGLASSARVSMESISQKLKEKMQLVNNQQLGLKKLITYLKVS